MSQGRAPQNFNQVNQVEISIPIQHHPPQIKPQPEHVPLPFAVPHQQPEVSAVTSSSPAHPTEHSRHMSRPNIIIESKHEQS